MSKTRGERVFAIFNYIFLVLASIMCLFPIMHVIALSLSSSKAATAGWVLLFPVEFTLESYKYALAKEEFVLSFGIALKRLLLGVSINMVVTILTAFPLSLSNKEFKARTFYVWFVFIPMILSGGIIPYYMMVRNTGLIDSIWALVLPTAVPIFNIIVLLNFFRQVPKEIGESAYIDGAGYFQTLVRIYLPLSIPALATLTLFAMVMHWNSWFDGLIFMNNPENYPLQSYLQTVVVKRDFSILTHLTKAELETMALVSDKTSKAAQIFIAAIPILCVYPFLQKYFIKGMLIGSVKG